MNRYDLILQVKVTFSKMAHPEYGFSIFYPVPGNNSTNANLQAIETKTGEY